MRATKNRVIVSTFSASVAVLASIATFEGFSEEAYPDPVHGWRVPTIGHGTTEGVKRGDQITREEAFERLTKEANNKYGVALKKCFGEGVVLHQYEYDAFISLAYSVGANAVCQSSITRKLQAVQHEAACNTILSFKYVTINGRKFDCSTQGNKVCYGLWTRRQSEYARCIGSSL